MKRLVNRETFHLDLPHLLEEYSQFSVAPESWFPEIPARHKVFSKFRVAHMRKRLPDGILTKKRMGYVWVDTDVSSLLFNKLICRSCHTIDNTEHAFRGGNYNYMYAPQIVSLFAGPTSPNDPKSLQKAKSRVTESLILDVNGNPYNIRGHQAVCNLWLCEGNTLFVAKLYDSAKREAPWAETIYTYLVNTANRLGLSLVLSPDWANILPEKLFTVESKIRMPWESAYKPTVPVRTEETFRLPFKIKNDSRTLEYYGDDYVRLQRVSVPVDGLHRMTAQGYLMLGEVPKFDYLGDDYSLCIGPDMAQECQGCSELGFDSDFRDTSRGPLCSSCMTNMKRCQKCRAWKDSAMMSGLHENYCLTCAEGLFSPCKSCGETADSERMIVGRCRPCFIAFGMELVAQAQAGMLR